MSTIESAGTTLRAWPMHRDRATQRYAHTDPLTSPPTLLDTEIPGMLSQRLAEVIWVFPLHTVAKCDSARCNITTRLPNL